MEEAWPLRAPSLDVKALMEGIRVIAVQYPCQQALQRFFVLSLSPSLGCSRPFFPPCSAFQAESTLPFCFQSSVLSLLHVLCLSVSLPCTLFQIQWGRRRGSRVYGPETLNLKTLKTKRDRDRVSKFVLVSLAYRGKDIVFTFIVEYSSLRDFGL